MVLLTRSGSNRVFTSTYVLRIYVLLEYVRRLRRLPVAPVVLILLLPVLYSVNKGLARRDATLAQSQNSGYVRIHINTHV